MVDCNWALVNNFLWCNWGFLELKQVILLTHGLICRPRRFNIVAEHHFALDGIQLALRYSQMLITEVWYSYATDMFCDPPYPVCAIEFPQNLPKWDRPNEKTGYKWCFLPPYLRSGYHSESLVDMSTFDHITFNLDVIQNEYRQIGFAQEYLADLEKLLEGRRLRRIKILGFGRINSLRALKQLAFVLAIKEHFGITEITSQEPVASEFEKGYLNSIGVATPPHDECDQPEEGLEEGEVTLFYWRMLNIHLRSNVVRANQDRLRKLIIIEDVPISAGTKWYPLLPARGKKRMDKKDAKVKERTLKHKAPTERSAKQKFNMRAKSIPLRYDVLQTTPSRSSFPWCPFFGMEMLSYPEDNLRDD
ncbi:hypothetical protein L596_027112 [Steinernema carpocapsae]|uniref:SRR1-like domain-containing protein n=2 Tax=Steinernema carpocapsae TaxID=34508 RepID=A0A4U5M3C8_STECR|nr:hypothetical protein L596_027112 [Steinernema carpocapsae]